MPRSSLLNDPRVNSIPGVKLVNDCVDGSRSILAASQQLGIAYATFHRFVSAIKKGKLPEWKTKHQNRLGIRAFVSTEQAGHCTPNRLDGEPDVPEISILDEIETPNENEVAIDDATEATEDSFVYTGRTKEANVVTNTGQPATSTATAELNSSSIVRPDQSLTQPNNKTASIDHQIVVQFYSTENDQPAPATDNHRSDAKSSSSANDKQTVEPNQPSCIATGLRLATKTAEYNYKTKNTPRHVPLVFHDLLNRNLEREAAAYECEEQPNTYHVYYATKAVQTNRCGYQTRYIRCNGCHVHVIKEQRCISGQWQRVLRHENDHSDACKGPISAEQLAADQLNYERTIMVEDRLLPTEATIQVFVTDRLTDMAKKFRAHERKVFHLIPPPHAVERTLIRHQNRTGVGAMNLNKPPDELRYMARPYTDMRWFVGPEAPDIDTAMDFACYATEADLVRMAESSRWIIDGTFAHAPNGYLQLVTVHVPVRSNYTQVCHIFMKNKTEKLYTEAFKQILAEMKEIGLTPKVDTVLLDFELAEAKGIENAMRAVFPDHVFEIKACRFHFSEAMLRRLNKAGLRSLYNNEREFRLWFRLLLALPLLPPGPDCLDKLWKERHLHPTLHLLNKMDAFQIEQCEKMLQSFEKFYLKPDGPAPPSKWNHHSNPGDMTTNAGESYHGVMRRSKAPMNATTGRYLRWLQERHLMEYHCAEYIENGGREKKKNKKYIRNHRMFQTMKATLAEREQQLTTMCSSNDGIVKLADAWNNPQFTAENYWRQAAFRVKERLQTEHNTAMLAFSVPDSDHDQTNAVNEVKDHFRTQILLDYLRGVAHLVGCHKFEKQLLDEAAAMQEDILLKAGIENAPGPANKPTKSTLRPVKAEVNKQTTNHNTNQSTPAATPLPNAAAPSTSTAVVVQRRVKPKARVKQNRHSPKPKPVIDRQNAVAKGFVNHNNSCYLNAALQLLLHNPLIQSTLDAVALENLSPTEHNLTRLLKILSDNRYKPPTNKIKIDTVKQMRASVDFYMPKHEGTNSVWQDATECLWAMLKQIAYENVLKLLPRDILQIEERRFQYDYTAIRNPEWIVPWIVVRRECGDCEQGYDTEQYMANPAVHAIVGVPVSDKPKSIQELLDQWQAPKSPYNPRTCCSDNCLHRQNYADRKQLVLSSSNFFYVALERNVIDTTRTGKTKTRKNTSLITADDQISLFGLEHELAVYSLVGALVFTGNHYTCFVRHEGKRQWLFANDKNVVEVDEYEMRSGDFSIDQNATLLAYRKIILA